MLLSEGGAGRAAGLRVLATVPSAFSNFVYSMSGLPGIRSKCLRRCSSSVVDNENDAGQELVED